MLVPLVGALLLLRILTDDRSAPGSRHSGSLNLSAVIAVIFVLLAFALIVQRRRGLVGTTLAALWLLVWTAIAVHADGASGETVREGVRELSVVALFVIVYNARASFTVPTTTRLVQLVSVVPAVLALYQLATQTGLEVAHVDRANGTLAHPNSAAMFFAIAATASAWRFFDLGRHRSDAVLTALFAAALVATFSIDGLATLAVMLTVFGVLRPGSFRVRFEPIVIAVFVILVFFLTPLGSQRVAGETSTSLAAAERGETNSSLDTRLYRWKTLLPEWEESPVVGKGLGVTTTSVDTRANRLNGLLPHNEYIRYLVETGIIGVVLLLASIALLFRGLFRRQRLRIAEAAGSVNAPALAIAVVVGCLVNSLADNTLLNSPTCYLAALVVASALALPGDAKRAAPSPRTA